MAAQDRLDQLKENFAVIAKIIQAEDMWERVPVEFREFSQKNLEDLVKFAYFGGFIDMAQVRRLLLLERGEMRRLLPAWYEEVRQKGCWLC